MPQQIEPFDVTVGEDQLADLQARLRQVRWPEPELVVDASQGVQLAKAQALVEYWRAS